MCTFTPSPEPGHFLLNPRPRGLSPVLKPGAKERGCSLPLPVSLGGRHYSDLEYLVL